MSKTNTGKETNMNTTAIGFTPDFEAYVVAKAGQLIAGGMAEQEAVEQAMRWTLALYAEIAGGKTDRARAFHAEATKAIRAGLVG